MLGGVRGGFMTEEYRQLTDGQKMLRYFYEELEAAFERGEPDLILQISRIAGDADVYIRPVTTGGLKNVAEELGLDSGARAVSLLRRLDDGGYLRLNYGSSGPNLDILTPTMEYIPDRGLFEIGELPHPDERFAAAIQRTRDVVEQSDIPESQKGSVLEALDKTITVLRTAHGLGDLIQQNWSSWGGLGL
jgi:hypothetical protein